MTVRHKIEFAAAVAVALAGAACSNRSQPMDDGLKQDLAAAKTAATSRLSISPLELGERVAPSPQQRAPRPVKHASPAVAPNQVVAQTPNTEKVAQPAQISEPQAPAPRADQQPAPAAVKPTPAPVRGDGEEQHGRYKSEAEIFRQMPWIRP